MVVDINQSSLRKRSIEALSLVSSGYPFLFVTNITKSKNRQASDKDPLKVLARRVSSCPVDAHFWKKYKENWSYILAIFQKKKKKIGKIGSQEQKYRRFIGFNLKYRSFIGWFSGTHRCHDIENVSLYFQLYFVHIHVFAIHSLTRRFTNMNGVFQWSQWSLKTFKTEPITISLKYYLNTQ